MIPPHTHNTVKSKIISSVLKRLFYIPTWVVIFLLLASTGAVLFDVYLIFTIDSFNSLNINGIEYFKDSEDYALKVQQMKKSFVYSGIIATLVGVITCRTLYKRKNLSNVPRHRH